MPTFYEQRQVGWGMLLWALVSVSAALVGIAAADPGAFVWFTWPMATTPSASLVVGAGGVAAVVLLTPLVFGTLTVRVDAQVLSIRFGIGLIGKRIPLADIEAVQVATLPWYAGRGIHRIRRGWVYNVAGGDVVDITRKNGTHVLVGSSEPRLLQNAIERARATGQRRG